MADDPQAEFGLVMPFVTCASKGGPHDDQSYVAGWEMGALDAELRHCWAAKTVEQILHEENQPQADLIAMKNGFAATFEPTGVTGWVRMTASRVHGEET